MSPVYESDGRQHWWCRGCTESVAGPELLDAHEMCPSCAREPQVFWRGRWWLRSHMGVCAGCGGWFDRPPHAFYMRRCVACWKLGRHAWQAPYGFTSHLLSGLRAAHLLPEDIAQIPHAQRYAIYGVGGLSVQRLNAAIPYTGGWEHYEPPEPPSTAHTDVLEELADLGVEPL